MTEATAVAGEGHEVHRVPISVPFVVAASLLCGVGLIGISYWLITQNPILLASIIPVVGGGLLFFSPRAGWDHA